MKDIFDDLPLSSENGWPQHRFSKHDSDASDEYLSMAEYEELRLLLTSAKAAFAQEDNDITPDPQIKKNIRAMVAARKKQFELPTINLQRILNFPVPAYQFGLAMVLVLFTAILVGRNMGSTSAKDAGAIYKMDTVFQHSQKATPPEKLLSDSQSNTLSPANSGSYYTDSIDINVDDNSSNTVAPTGVKSNDAGYNLSPGSQKMDRPRDRDIPTKGGGPMEDSSKWNRHLHGLL